MEKSWQAYVIALGGQKPPASNIDTGMPFTNTEGGPSTGFVQWKPKDTLKNYDAMNSAWLGVTASDAYANKVFKTEYAPVNK
jgi:hypothetical protein